MRAPKVLCEIIALIATIGKNAKVIPAIRQNPFHLPVSDPSYPIDSFRKTVKFLKVAHVDADKDGGTSCPLRIRAGNGGAAQRKWLQGLGPDDGFHRGPEPAARAVRHTRRCRAGAAAARLIRPA